MAGLVIPVTHTSANGIHLGAETNPKQRKMLLLDTGIFQRLLGLNIGTLLLEKDLDVINIPGILLIYCAVLLLRRKRL
jgi:hypothetical protein